MITVNLRYSGKGNAALDFAKEMTESGTVAKIRAEKGNLRYEYYLPFFDDSPDKTVLLIDQWENQELKMKSTVNDKNPDLVYI